MKQRLLSPLGLNLMIGHTISEATKIAIINSMHVELRAIRVTKYNFEIRSDL